MVVSDGIQTQNAMLAINLNDLVKSERLQKGSIVKLLQFVLQYIANKEIIVIFELEVVQAICEAIGQLTLHEPCGARPAQLLSSIVPIAALKCYQCQWTIKARVTAKSDIRCYEDVDDAGRPFYFDLVDYDGGEIRAFCFNDVVDQFFTRLEVDRDYLISNGSVVLAQSAYSHLPNDYEITLHKESSVEPCFHDDASIPRLQFNL